MYVLVLGQTKQFCRTSVRASKRHFVRRNKTALGPRGQASFPVQQNVLIAYLNKLKIVENTKQI
jgi:hypothetical protein